MPTENILTTTDDPGPGFCNSFNFYGSGDDRVPSSINKGVNKYAITTTQMEEDEDDIIDILTQ